MICILLQSWGVHCTNLNGFGMSGGMERGFAAPKLNRFAFVGNASSTSNVTVVRVAARLLPGTSNWFNNPSSNRVRHSNNEFCQDHQRVRRSSLAADDS